MPEYYDYEDAILARQEAWELWEDGADEEFLAEMLLRDLGCTDEDLEGMLEEWEADDAETNN